MEVGFEMGPAVLGPDGTVLALGANGQNAIYHPPATLYGTGTWTTAEPFADSAGTSYGMADGTASLLPDGSVLALASPGVYQRPTIAANDQPRHVTAGQTITLSGTQLSGLSRGSNYGDDGDSATNFPVVRIVNQLTHRVEYAKTFGFSEQVAAGRHLLASTQVALPADLDQGPAQLVVVANGSPLRCRASWSADPSGSVSSPRTNVSRRFSRGIRLARTASETEPGQAARLGRRDHGR
jgi:hypothetical protein